MDIIPAIDIIDGNCVRLTQGDYTQQKIYSQNPLDMARQFEECGIRRLHLVDLDGARTGKIMNLAVLESIAAKTKLVIDFGGGIKTRSDIQNVLDAGVSMVAIGSVAVKDPDLFHSWVDIFGYEKILLGADVKGEKIAVNGWKNTTNITLPEFIGQNITKGVTSIFCTDIGKDGLLQGPSVDLYRKIIQDFSQINLIASGGISCVNDLRTLEAIGCAGAIVGKALYENRITFNDLKLYLNPC